MLRPVSLLLLLSLGLLLVWSGCGTPSGAVGAGSRGERFFLLKCNGCHPSGGQGAGPPVESAELALGILEKGKTSGRHAVPDGEWDPFIAYLRLRFPGTPAPPAASTAAATPAAVPGAAPAPPPAGVADAGPAPAATAPVPAVAPSMSGDVARGERYYQAKCNRCHPGGGKGRGPAVVGKAVPGVLVKNSSGGRHAVPPEEWDHLLVYMVALGGVPAGGAAPDAGTPGPALAAPTPTTPIAPTAPPTTPPTALPTAPPTPTPPAGPPEGGVLPPSAGMVNCTCACQCPPNAPPETLPAACLCQCSCPR